DLDLQAELADPRREGLARRGVAEVGADRLRPDAVASRQLVGKRRQPILAPGDQGDPVSTAGELAGDRLADAGRGTGDERGPGLGGRWKRHAAQATSAP